MIKFDETKQEKRIEDLHRKEEEDLARFLSQKYNLEYIDLTTAGINIDSLRLVPEEKARAAGLATFYTVGKKVKVGVLSPAKKETLEVIEDLKTKNYVPIMYMVSKDGLEKVWKWYKDLSFSYETKAGALDISNDEILDIVSSVKTIADIQKLINDTLKQKRSFRVTRILEIILAGALAIDASDIHIEPEESYVRLRYRLDGVLADILKFDLDTYSLMLSRLKLLSGLKLNVSGAQDGRFTVRVKDSDIEIRTSMLPGAYNDSVVMRVLDPKSIRVPMNELGINAHLLSVIEHEITKPNGMLLTTGPTGSGKTTTLYAFLRKIHTPDIKIITIENPIEYHLAGIVQTQTDEDKEYTFAGGLRAALRQDPDVIMVGEIRDRETAETAVNASLTGHLVFSTLHTNNAAGTFPRLLDLGVNPKVITSAINLAMAQRLVRKLCPYCKKEVPIEGEHKALIEKVLSTLPRKEEAPAKLEMFGPAGCDKCNNTGYKSRIGIHEAILADQAIESVILQNPSEREVKKAAQHQGILDLRQDGIIKVLQGITSLDELGRVVDLEEEFL